MIAEKPFWVKHEGLQIFSIDVQPNGERFATGGGDHKVFNFSSSSIALWFKMSLLMLCSSFDWWNLLVFVFFESKLNWHSMLKFVL
jgi:hypothetical protein